MEKKGLKILGIGALVIGVGLGVILKDSNYSEKKRETKYRRERIEFYQKEFKKFVNYGDADLKEQRQRMVDSLIGKDSSNTYVPTFEDLDRAYFSLLEYVIKKD